MRNLKTALAIVLILSFTACDKIAESIANDNSFLLARKLWTFSSLSGFDDSTNQTMTTQRSGNTYNFRLDGTYTAVMQGDSSDNDWEFDIDKTVLTLKSGTANQEEWTIVTLNETELTVSIKNADALNGTFTLTFN